MTEHPGSLIIADMTTTTYTVIDGIAYPATTAKDVYRVYTCGRGLYSIVQASTGLEVCTARGKKLARRRLDAVRRSGTDDVHGLRVLATAIR